MLSVIITHHKTPVLLKLCLRSIEQALQGTDLKREVLIVDSEANFDDQEMIKEMFPEVKFISFENNVGYAKIVNAGLSQAQGQYLLILNADIIILEDAINKMVRFLKNQPHVGVVGPQLLTFTNEVQESCFRRPDFWGFMAFMMARRTIFGRSAWGKKVLDQFLLKPYDLGIVQWPVDWLQGSAMMVSREAAQKVGFLDERYFMYFEDADWCQRFWRHGFEVVYLPQAKMAHYYYRASRKWGGVMDIILNKYTRLHIISALKYFWKWRKLA
jgi:N-acetylglucosaminyl-diphospho-decaprenol L-rhamnosyltransferase